MSALLPVSATVHDGVATPVNVSFNNHVSKMKYFYIAAMTLSLCLGSCRTDNTGDRTSSMSLSPDGVVTVSPSSPVAKRIVTAPVTSSPFSARFSAAATVNAIPSCYAEIAAPVSGRVVKSFVRLGQQVQAGTPLFQVTSSDFTEMCRACLDAQREMEQSGRALQRARRLLDNKMGTAREVEEAETAFELSSRAFENAAASLRVYGTDPSSITLGEPLTVRSPISGRIVADNIVTGQYVADDADPLLIVADLNQVWIKAAVKEKDFRKLASLEKVEVTVPSSRDSVIQGTVYHVSDILDPETRAVEVIVLCDNRDHSLKPNMFCTVGLTDAVTDAILVPTSALLQSETGCFVMKQEGAGSYRKVPVETGMTDGDMTVIERGVSVGDSIIVKGAFYLLDAR